MEIEEPSFQQQINNAMGANPNRPPGIVKQTSKSIRKSDMGFGLIRRDSNLPKVTRSQVKQLADFEQGQQDDDEMESVVGGNEFAQKQDGFNLGAIGEINSPDAVGGGGMGGAKMYKNDNRAQPIQHTGKVGGGKAMSVQANFAFLMQNNQKHAGQNKARNFKDARKAGIRRNEKLEREYQKDMAILRKEQQEQDRIEWAPQDRVDQKFRNKMEKKVQDNTESGPSRKEITQQLYEAEQATLGKKKKQAKSSWGKTK